MISITQDLKNNYPKCILRDLRETKPEFITIELTCPKINEAVVKYYVDSLKELIHFKNSVHSACEKFLKEDEERRR